jgi:hypothetical protein
MKRANTEVYEQFRKVKKDVARKSKSLREVQVKSKERKQKAVDRLTHKYEREVELAVDAATRATKTELKTVHLTQRIS